jgi:hypothetical protein
MNPRYQLIAVLVVIELAIVSGMISAVRGGNEPWYARGNEASAQSGPNVAEGGTHKVFAVGNQPVLTVDIGYADLTIETGSTSQIEVAVSKSAMFGPMRATAPITAEKTGDTVAVMTSGGPAWSIGDDRMVTVTVPPQTRVRVTNAGDISVTGLRADATIHSVGNGSIDVVDFSASSLRVRATNGPISLHGVVVTRLDASSRNDNVEGSALQVRDGTIESADGNVSLGFASGSDTVVSADASDGSVHVSGFPSSSVVGTQRTNGDDEESSSQTVRIGAGNGRLDVHASDGSIHLRQDG